MLLVLHLPFAPLRADARGQARLQRALLPASRHDRDFATQPPAPTRKLRFRFGFGDAASRGTCAGGARALLFGLSLASDVNRGGGGAKGVATPLCSACGWRGCACSNL